MRKWTRNNRSASAETNLGVVSWNGASFARTSPSLLRMMSRITALAERFFTLNIARARQVLGGATPLPSTLGPNGCNELVAALPRFSEETAAMLRRVKMAFGARITPDYASDGTATPAHSEASHDLPITGLSAGATERVAALGQYGNSNIVTASQ